MSIEIQYKRSSFHILDELGSCYDYSRKENHLIMVTLVGNDKEIKPYQRKSQIDNLYSLKIYTNKGIFIGEDSIFCINDKTLKTLLRYLIPLGTELSIGRYTGTNGKPTNKICGYYLFPKIGEVRKFKKETLMLVKTTSDYKLPFVLFQNDWWKTNVSFEYYKLESIFKISRGWTKSSYFLCYGNMFQNITT
jgi:hypothetical protein